MPANVTAPTKNSPAFKTHPADKYVKTRDFDTAFMFHATILLITTGPAAYAKQLDQTSACAAPSPDRVCHIARRRFSY